MNIIFCVSSMPNHKIVNGMSTATAGAQYIASIHGVQRKSAGRITRGAFARPGAKAIAYKTSVLAQLSVPIVAGIGNRQSDIVAYTRAGVPAKQILIHLPAYADEVRADLAAGKAIGFADYAGLPALLPPPPRR